MSKAGVQSSTQRAESVRHLIGMVRAVVAGRAIRLPEGFIDALSSQASVAAFSDGKTLVGMSLNTHKKYVEQELNRYAHFDRLRLTALKRLLDAPRGVAKPGKRDKRALLALVEAQKQQIAMNHQDLVQCTELIERLVGFCKSAAEKQPKLKQEWTVLRAKIAELCEPGGSSFSNVIRLVRK